MLWTHSSILAWKISWIEELAGHSTWSCNRVQQNWALTHMHAHTIGGRVHRVTSRCWNMEVSTNMQLWIWCSIQPNCIIKNEINEVSVNSCNIICTSKWPNKKTHYKRVDIEFIQQKSTWSKNNGESLCSLKRIIYQMCEKRRIK